MEISSSSLAFDSLKFINNVKVANVPPYISHLLCPPPNTIHTSCHTNVPQRSQDTPAEVSRAACTEAGLIGT